MLLIFLFGIHALGFSTESTTQQCPNEASSTNVESSVENETQLLIFVSLGMPRTSLLQWSEQAKKAGGILVLRGLKDNSLPQTLAYTNKIWGEGARSVVIDPTAFQRFAINTVPAVLITKNALQPCTKKACEIPTHDVVYGDVGLAYALNKIKEQGELGDLVQNYLTRLNR